MAEQLKSFRSVGTIYIGETKGAFEIIYSHPGSNRTTLTLENFQITQVFDGQKAWMKDQNGQVMELTGPDKRQLVNTSWLLGKAYLQENANPDEVLFLKDTVIDDENYSIYSALPESGDSLRLFYNSKTCRIEIISECLDDLDILTFLSDFRDVDGFEMAFGHDTKSVISELNSTLEINQIEVNQKYDDSLFVFDMTSPDDYFFPDNADSIVVPMLYIRGHIFIKAAIDDNPAVYFILDSGAGINFLSRKYADSLGLNLSGGIPSKGMAGYETTGITNLDSLTIGGIKLFNQNVAIIDLSNIGKNVPEGMLGGLLGYDLLSRFPIRIDYLNQAVIIYNPEAYRAPSVDYAINLEYNMKVPIVDAEICGIPGKFLLDLGNAFGLILHKPFIDNNSLKNKFADINKIANGISGVGGKSETYSAIADYFSFGPAHLKELRVLVAEGEQGIIKSTDVDGNIGNGLLQNFSVIFDYPKKKIYILPLEK
ncbi:MAG: hypothetical protein GY865_16700 [candidate division Zixibacteria bacterium]|nr:hypothetical protein [candidate division Zixibacteria bacterium]